MRSSSILNKKSSRKEITGSLRVLKTYRSCGVVQVAVKLITKSHSAQSLYKKTLKVSFTCSELSVTTSSVSSKTINSYKLNTSRTVPGDFIEPIEDLSIPSTIDYISHTKHLPTKSMTEAVTSRSHLKPPRPNNLLTSRHLPKKIADGFLQKNTKTDRIRKIS